MAGDPNEGCFCAAGFETVDQLADVGNSFVTRELAGLYRLDSRAGIAEDCNCGWIVIQIVGNLEGLFNALNFCGKNA